jgi:hypothetical protein
MMIAALGFLWLPHNGRTAWFLSKEERVWAEERIRRDRSAEDTMARGVVKDDDVEPLDGSFAVRRDGEPPGLSEEETHGLLRAEDDADEALKDHAPAGATSKTLVTDDRGLSRTDVLSAALDWKLWYLLTCNILSSMPVTAFSVFLPLVLEPMTTSPAYANLMTAPPFLIGAVVLYSFAWWSDKTRQRLVPILWGLALLLVGLTGVVLIPGSTAPVARYVALCVLLAGTFVASPLTVAWMAGNIPEAGKRSVVLGINGWGNLAGVFSSLLFAPRFAPTYAVPFFGTLACVLMAFAGYAGFRALLVRENRWRARMLREWRVEDVEAERKFGKGPLGTRGNAGTVLAAVARRFGLEAWSRRIQGWWPEEEGRKGDERITFVYGL